MSIVQLLSPFVFHVCRLYLIESHECGKLFACFIVFECRKHERGVEYAWFTRQFIRFIHHRRERTLYHDAFVILIFFWLLGFCTHAQQTENHDGGYILFHVPISFCVCFFYCSCSSIMTSSTAALCSMRLVSFSLRVLSCSSVS